MRALWRSTLQEPPAKLCQTHRLLISSSSVSLLLSLKSRLWPRFVSNLPWGQESSVEGARERRCANITGTLFQSLPSNKTENDFSDDNSFSSLWTQPKKLCQKQTYIIPALFMICSVSVFISRLRKFQVDARRAPHHPRLQPPGGESFCTPIPSWPAQLALHYSGENVITNRKACLACRLAWQLKHLPLWLQTGELPKPEE